MYRIMLQKLWHKKWMNLCLLVGSILLIATVVSFPLYQAAIYDRILQEEFDNYVASTGEWPAKYKMQILSQKDFGGGAILRMEELMNNIYRNLGVTEKETISFYELGNMDVHCTMNRPGMEKVSIRMAALSNLPAHAKLLSGEMYSGSGLSEDGSIEIVMTQAAMTELKLLVGDTLETNLLTDAEGKPIRLLVKGVYAPESTADYYWHTKAYEQENMVFMDLELFRSRFTGENAGRYTVTCTYYPMFEYKDLRAPQVKGLLAATVELTEKGAYRKTMSRPAYRDILETYLAKQDRIKATLMILQVPVLIMLGAFLFMISGQMYDMERNEISVIKSRGSSGGQIFRLYLYQCTVLTLVGGALGIPLGGVFSRILGSAKSFLEFDNTRVLELTYTKEVWQYAAGVMAASLLIMTLPAIKHSRVTIVKLKQQKALKKRSWWEKIFLDVILLGISLYGYYNFHKNAGNLGENVLQGEALDPLLYISSSLFIVGLGLLFLRLQPLIVQLIYLVGRRFWKPASYISFMENAKNGRKQQFIMLFLIITISLGMYHATVARTILQNAYRNEDYINGADIVEQEVWKALVDENGFYTGEYAEPDFAKYGGMDFAKGYTKVLLNPNGYMSDKSGTGAKQDVTVMGIHTKEFGGVTWVDADLNNRHYYEYLNDLAQDADGILVSDNFRTKLGYNIGDKITYKMEYEKNAYSITGKIVGFFQYWPGYAPTGTELNPDGTVTSKDNLLIVAHYSKLRQVMGVKPYQVWIGLKEGRSMSEAYAWFQEKGVRMTKFVDKAERVESAMSDPLLQGTNGILTIGFVVTILLCAVGYLIYWIMAIRSREMIFGVLRACGMHKSELIQTLMNEQLFCGVFSVAAGIGIGKIASDMFVPIIQQAYAATNQVLPMRLVVETSDLARLYGVIIAVMLLCLVVLILLIFKMNVTKALKLGEE